MKSIQFFLIILLAEIIALILMFISLVIQKTLIFFITLRDQKWKKCFEQLLSSALSKKSESIPSLPGPLQRPRLLMRYLLQYQPSAPLTYWPKLRKSLVDRYILPKIKYWHRSIFWEKRLLAARAHYFSHEENDIAKMIRLLDDPSFLVQSAAARCAKEKQEEKLLDKLLQKFLSSKGFAYLHWKDILSSCASKAFPLAEKRLQEKISKRDALILLDLLSSCPCAIEGKYLETLMTLQDTEITAACVKLHAANPMSHSEHILLSYVDDPNADIRKFCYDGLKAFPSRHNIALLKQGLKDSAWPVRLQAAASLEFLGEEGIALLNTMYHLHFTDESQIYGFLLEKRGSNA